MRVVRDDWHEFDSYNYVRTNSLYASVSSKLEDAFTKSVTTLKSSEDL